MLYLEIFLVLEFGLELDEEDSSAGSNSQLVRKNISLKLKQGKPRGRTRKPTSPRAKRTSAGRKKEDRDIGDEEIEFKKGWLIVVNLQCS